MPDADVIVVGGGPSGLTAAIEAARHGESVLLLEKYSQPGKKLLATGNGRCNLLNLNDPPIYYGDSSLASKVMGFHPAVFLQNYWYELGIPIRFDSEGRGYPWSMQASSVLDALLRAASSLGVRILEGKKVIDLHQSGDSLFEILTEQGDSYTAHRVIVATGGLAQEKLGGNMDAWPWLKRLGHRMIPAIPALVPLLTDRRSVSGLAGIRVRCSLTVYTDQIRVYQTRGELLFTETGISGICAMQCARSVIGGRSICAADLVEGLFSRESDLHSELIRRRTLHPAGSPTDLLMGICVPRMSFAVCKQAGIRLRGESCGDLSDDDIFSIAAVLRAYRMPILGTEGFDRAQVTAGGVSENDIDPANMESLRVPGLHMTGELVNVDGDCGGYNLMFAVMSGIKAGRNRGGA